MTMMEKQYGAISIWLEQMDRNMKMFWEPCDHIT